MSRATSLDVFAHPHFFESFERFQPAEHDFLLPVKEHLTGDWTFTRKTVWFGCTPPVERARPLPKQGWKIHVSSAQSNALPILRSIVPILDAGSIDFKFALDRRVLAMMNSKRWGRQGAGKFVTIYPVDEGEFVDLLATLHGVTRGFEGIYILSDRRYKDSKVLFYRYGGIRPVAIHNERGEEVTMLISPTGERIPDERKPYFHLPHWVRDPFPAEADETGEQIQDEQGRISLRDGRYLVENVLGFTNSGGIYLARDRQSGETVVIKEARPHVSSGVDSIAALEKEHRILSRIADSGAQIAPRPVELFRDWEHLFLAQEYLQGVQLTSFSARYNVTLMTRPSLEDTQRFFADFRTIFVQLARILETLHENDIVFGDLSPNNVIVLQDPLRVRILDFEGATEIGVDRPAHLFTPGFAYRDQMYGRDATPQSDYFALGALMHYFLAPFNQIFPISPRSRFTFLREVTEDVGFPGSIRQVVHGLMENEPDVRPSPRQVIEVLKRDHELRAPRFRVDGPDDDGTYERYVERICDYCLATADFSRHDRLFPAFATVFHTNPLSLAYGACGVAHSLATMGRPVPESVIDWILQPTSDRDRYPPGLYLGLAGIAWSLLELGRPEPAIRIMARAHRHPLANRTSDFFHGAAGLAVANLRFFIATQDELFRDKALESGDHLLAAAVEADEGIHWPANGSVPLGLGHGASGISLALLYLYLATGSQKYLDAGVKGLGFDLSRGVTNLDRGLAWRRYDDESRILYPYWRYGSAGVGAVAVRYHALLGDEVYSEAIENIFLDLDRKYSVFPGLYIGLAGIGETLLDFYRFTGEERFRRAAYRVATGLSLFQIEREEGLAFPGDTLAKICCDLATGSAGVGRFFHRLVRGGEAPLLLDSLLIERIGHRPRELVAATAAPAVA